jgi:uncharacterized protein DUF6069
MNTSANAAIRPRASSLRVAGGVVAAAVAASVVNAVIAYLGHAAGAPSDFHQLQPSSYVFLTVIGVLAGAAGWAAVRRWSRRPGAALRLLAPAVIAVSLVPDLALLFTGASGLGVATLMVMHLATGAVALPVYARALPLARRKP